jgi:branched-chain amino acid transport system substrate-binding protein
LPLVEDTSATAKAFVARWNKVYPDREPSSEMSLNYTAMHATALAMKLAGTTTDAAAIRAQLDKAMKALPESVNVNSLDGVDERGGSMADTRVAIIENGKVREIKLRDLSK